MPSYDEWRACVKMVILPFSYYSNHLAWIYNMRKYLLHVLIISFVFLLAPTVQVASYAGKLEDAKEKEKIY